MTDRPTIEPIEITPEMISAGARELALSEPHDSYTATAEAVYLAMTAARLGISIDLLQS